MNRVVVSRAVMGICHMQACAIKDATDEEVLIVCNKENPSGTTNGWSKVYRDKGDEWMGNNCSPVQCEEEPDRVHLVVEC